MKLKVGIPALIVLVAIGGLFLLVRACREAPGVPQVGGTPAPGLRQTLTPDNSIGSKEDKALTQEFSRKELGSSSYSPTADEVLTGDTPAQEAATPRTDPTQLAPVATPNPTEGLIAPPMTPIGHQAPNASAEPLSFQQVWVFNNPETGAFSGKANTTNTGPTFLNNLVISWRIMDNAGQVLDKGKMTWPNLAPNETATIPFNGTKPYVDNWERVEFGFTP